jgi:hypothetical protein
MEKMLNHFAARISPGSPYKVQLAAQSDQPEENQQGSGGNLDAERSHVIVREIYYR